MKEAAEEVEVGHSPHNFPWAVMIHMDTDGHQVVDNQCIGGWRPFDYADGDGQDWCSGPSALVGHIMRLFVSIEDNVLIIYY